MTSLKKVSLSEVNQSIDTPNNNRFGQNLRAFLGPGALVAVGYMDPGNWITSVVGGATYKYSLLFIILISSLIAMQLQQMAGKLGIVTQMDLAQATAYHSPKWLRYTLWVILELALMATDTLLEKPMTEAERTDFIRGIRSQTDKLDFLFQALVKTSRLETGVIQLDKKPGRLFDTVAQAMSGIVYAAEKKEIAVSVDCPEDLTVSHDSKWTSEALFNLLDNAVKYTPAGGKIAVSVVLWEMYVEIKVIDTGKGISESNQAAIFRRFYREEEVHEQQGVGIGLYLAREIVTRQGGYIKVVSEPGKGSEFSIMLPTK